VHVQHTEERAFYALERLWRDCPTIDFNPGPAPAVSTPAVSIAGARTPNIVPFDSADLDS
jgi:ribosome-associated protein